MSATTKRPKRVQRKSAQEDVKEIAAPVPAPVIARAPSRAPYAGGSLDGRMIAFMRCVLAITALAIIYIDPTEPTRFVELTYTSLTAYCIYSVIVLFVASQSTGPLTHWIDIAWATYLVALTQGTSSIFFFLFVFAILVGSFTGGYRQGIALTLASSVLFACVGTLFAPPGDSFELNRTVIRTVYLLALGWMMAFWGGREIDLRRRLELLGNVGHEWNPRLGVDRVIFSNLERLLAPLLARESLLVVSDPNDTTRATMYKAVRDTGGVHTSATRIDGEAARLLLGLAARGALAHDRRTPPERLDARTAANLLEAPAFAAVPYSQKNGVEGCLVVTRAEGAFDSGELEFLGQLAVAISHVAENTHLIEELVNKAAEHERFRISLDIHDATLQPYIGLKLGLDALLREARGNPVENTIEELLARAEATIRDLRGFATGIRERAPISGESLVKAVREQAERFQRYYGVRVQVECDENLFVGPPIASEAYRMISEGLSNVMRHTTARSAFVRLNRNAEGLRLVIANDAWGEQGRRAPFTPRSINARAIYLGGSSFVEYGDDGRAAVHVTIPA